MLASPLYYDRFVRMDGAWPFAERELCVDSSCVTPAQFQAMVAATSIARRRSTRPQRHVRLASPRPVKRPLTCSASPIRVLHRQP